MIFFVVVLWRFLGFTPRSVLRLTPGRAQGHMWYRGLNPGGRVRGAFVLPLQPLLLPGFKNISRSFNDKVPALKVGIGNTGD